jgi:putative flippase GtrA
LKIQNLKNVILKKIDKNILKQFIIFLIIGGIAFFIDLGFYIILLIFFNHFYAKLCSFIAATCFTYIMNKFFTFKLKDLSLLETFKFIILYSISSYINAFINQKLFLLTNNVRLAFVVATAVCLFINFFGLRIFVFKKKD